MKLAMRLQNFVLLLALIQASPSPASPTCHEVFLHSHFLNESPNYFDTIFLEYNNTRSERGNHDLSRPVVVRPNAEGLMLANGVRVTGESKYPLDFVRSNLALTDSFLASLPAQANILSVGEGMSGLGPFLASRFPNTRFLDIWYENANLPPEMREYVTRYRKHLVNGSSTRIPLPDRSQKLVVSHRLLNNFYDDKQAQYKTLDEMIRVTEPGGFVIAEMVKLLGRPYLESLIQQLYAKYGDSIQVTLVSWNPTREPHYLSNGIEDYRIVIHRRR